MSDKHIYFASDFHLGAYADRNDPLRREKKVVRWLDSIKPDCAELYLLGDVFDFWFEYKYVVPKGFVRLLGKLAEFADAGIPVHMFTGNHDVWMFDYFESQLNAKIYRGPVERTWSGKRFMLGHGDGLGPGDSGYKVIKKVFSNPLAQRMFAALHPGFGAALARYFSRTSRESTGEKDLVFLGEKEYLIQYCKEVLQHEHFDYFIFGHRHLLIDVEVGSNARYVNLGEWFSGCHYAKFANGKLSVHRFES